MRNISRLLAASALAASLFLTDPAMARQPKKYQVTGPVLEVTDDYIAIDKAGDRWEIARDKDTKVTGTLKVGEGDHRISDDSRQRGGQGR